MLRIAATISIIITFHCIKSNGQLLVENIDGKKINVPITFYSATNKTRESVTTEYIKLYQKYISGIRGQECPMYPSCSNFGLKTFSEKQIISAFIMTSDRIMRCGHDNKFYSLALRNNGFKSLDFPSYDKPNRELYYTQNSYYFAYSDSIKDNEKIVFIKKLMNNQYFQEALIELMHLEVQNNQFQIEDFINKLICLSALGEYEKAIFEYETKCPVEFSTNAFLSFQISKIHYKLQNYNLAMEANETAFESCNDSSFMPKIILMNGLLSAHRNNWQKAINTYKSLADFNDYRTHCEKNIELVENAIKMKNKNPVIAGAFSLIPGLGYAYAGHRQTAITALLVNGLLTFATISNINNTNYGMATLTGVFNLSFYIGGVYGAVQSAKRYNEEQKKSIIRKLEFNSNL